MVKRVIIRCIAVLTTVAFFFSGGILNAIPGNFEDSLKDGIAQFKHENYDEALEIFGGLRSADPKSSLAAYYLGLTYKQLENYTAAIEHLKASLTMTPKIKGALIELIDTLYRLDMIEDAKEWIKVAEDSGVRPAQAAYLKGLTLIKAEQYEDAVEAFENAKGLDAQLAQSADYQTGLAYVKLKKFSAAGDIFQGLVALDPNTDIAEYASRYVDALEQKKERDRPFHYNIRTAFEYDSNVVLKPGDTALVTQIADADDTRQVFDLSCDYTLKSEDEISKTKAGYAIRYSKQNDFGNYDMVANNFSLQPSFVFDKLRVSLPASYGHTIVNGKNYLSSASVGEMNNYMLGKTKMAQAGILYKSKKYLRPPFGDEDRTGNELLGTGGLFLFFMKNKGYVNLKYSVNKDWPEGANWEYWGNRISAGFLLPVGENFKLNAQSDFFLQQYSNIHTVFAKKRKDQTYSLSTVLSYEFMKNAEIQTQYTFVSQQSNINVYEYDRNVISCAVQYKF
ncbi:MAG: tetratricopeptide repeat protein [Candidatus Omnitrophota bacterium]